MESGTDEMRAQETDGSTGNGNGNGNGTGAQDDTTTKLKEFAQSEYKVEASELEGMDKRGTIELLVKSMVSDVLKKDSSEITSETSFKELGADSLDMVEMLMRIEDVVRLFGETKIDDADAEIDTVGGAVDKIEEYIDKSVNAA